MNRFMNRYAPAIAVMGGIMFLVFGAIRSVNLFTYRSAEAVVISYEEEYDAAQDTIEPRATVGYEVEGKRYEAVLDDYTEKYYVGKTVMIKYDPDDPGKVITAGVLLPVILLGFGTLCIAGGLLGAARKRRG